MARTNRVVLDLTDTELSALWGGLVRAEFEMECEQDDHNTGDLADRRWRAEHAALSRVQRKVLDVADAELVRIQAAQR